MSNLNISIFESLDCLDGMVIFGLRSNFKMYTKCKRKLDDYIIEEVVKEFGIEEALKEKVLTNEEAEEYLKTHN